MDGSDQVITGNWMQGGKPLPLTLERATPDAEQAQTAALEAQKDYSYTSPNDLPGHWQGTLDVKNAGIKLRLALNIAKMPDGNSRQHDPVCPAQCAPGMAHHRRLFQRKA